MIFGFLKKLLKRAGQVLHFRDAESILSNFSISLTTVFPYLDCKIYTIDLSTGNLSLDKNKGEEMNFNIIITLFVVKS